MFVFEGNAVVINVKAETKNQHKYPKILSSAILTVLAIFMIFAFFGYYGYYDKTVNPIFVLTFDTSNLTVVIMVFICLNAFMSYPV